MNQSGRISLNVSLSFLFVLLVNSAFSQLTINSGGSLLVPRWLHESQVLLNGKVLVFGGNNGDYLNLVNYSSSELYDPLTDTWASTGSMSATREDFTSVVLNDGKVLAIGGAGNTCEIYDPASGLWSAVANMNESHQKAVKLNDGRVLAVASTRAEIYDPYSNTWQYTDTLKLNHGGNISLIALDNGKVLLTGGTGAPNRAELFDPQNNSWTLLSNLLKQSRNGHSSVKLADGRVLLVTGDATQKGCEIYNPATNTFALTGSILENLGGNYTILQDDGTVLIAGIGNFGAPTNTRWIQTFNPGTGTWTSGVYNYLGTNAYSINKLKNGKILIAGGSATTGNGASTICRLVIPTSFSGCVAPDLTLSISGTSACYGQSPTASITGGESGVTYTAYLPGLKASSSVAGPGTLNLNLTSSMFLPGTNFVSIHAQKTGCPTFILDNSALINSTLSIPATPVLTPMGIHAVCSGDSILLSTGSGYPAYLWSNGVTTTVASYYAKPSNSFRVKFDNGSGCTSVPSNFVKVFAPGTASAGPAVNACEGAPAFQLTGFTPAGGVWTGPGVSPGGMFDPGIAGVGTHVLTYSICATSSNRSVTVNPTTFPALAAAFVQDTLCPGQYASLQVLNSKVGISYTLRKGTTAIGSAQSGNGGTLTFSTGAVNITTTFNVRANFSNFCGSFQQIDSTGLTVVIAKALTNMVFAAKPNICRNTGTSIKVYPSEIGVSYQLKQGYSNIGPPLNGNGDTLTLPTGILYSTTTFSVVATVVKYNCQTTLTIAPTVTVRTVTPAMDPVAPVYFIGDTVQFTNTTNADTYSWLFDASASKLTDTAKVPLNLTYSTTGMKKIKMTSYTWEGCLDTVIRYIEIVDPSTPSSPEIECLRNDRPGHYMVLDYHLDKKHNSYVAGYFPAFAMKTDSLGNTLWSKEYAPDGYSGARSVFVTGITSDSKGNAYISGHCFGAASQTFGAVKFTETPSPSKNYGKMFVVKIDPSGVEKWVIWAHGNPDYYISTAATDVVCDSLDRIYISGYTSFGNNVIHYADNSTSTLLGYQGRDFIVQVDTLGKYVDQTYFGAKTSGPYGLLGGFCVNNGSFTYDQVVMLNPKLKVKNNGDVLISTVDHSNANLLAGIYNKQGGWKKTFTAATGGVGIVEGFSVDNKYNFYITGTFNNTTVINSFSITPYTNKYNAVIPYSYVLKADSAGSVKWYDLNTSVFIHDIECSGDGKEYIVGKVGAVGGFRSANGSTYGIIGRGGMDYFLGTLDSSGNLLFMDRQGGPFLDRPYYLENAGCNNVFVCSARDRTHSQWPYPSYINNMDDPVVGKMSISQYAMDGVCKSSACLPLPWHFYDHDAGVVNMNPFPVMPSGNNNLYASLVAYGQDNLTSCNVSVSIDGSSAVTVPWTGNAYRGDTIKSILLGNFNLIPGKHAVKIWTSLPNGFTDSVPANDTLLTYIFTCGAPLSGTYNVGAGEPDFENFTTAAAALYQCGISGPVVFRIKDGTYTEQLLLGAVTGASASNTITFEAQSNDSTKVILQHNSDSYKNYIISFTGSGSYFTFKRITFQPLDNINTTCVSVNNLASRNTFKGCQFLNLIYSGSSSISGSWESGGYNVFDNNYFVGGMYGISFQGPGGNSYEPGVQIKNNVFKNQGYGPLFLRFQEYIQISNNTMESNTPITGQVAGINFNLYNRYMVVENNRINMPGAGILLMSNSNSGIIRNNFITVRPGPSQYIKSGISVWECIGDSIYHNSINVLDTNALASGLDLGYSSGSNYLHYIKNNIFSNYGNGLCIRLTKHPNLTNIYVDYNDLYTTGPVLARQSYNTTTNNFPTLASWQAALGKDLNSVSVDPLYISATDLHTQQTQLNNLGQANNSVKKDIDGQFRSKTTPDIGADEITPFGIFAPIDSVVNVKCFGGNTGKVYITPNSGAAPYTYAWSNGLTTEDITGLSIGTYSVLVTDANGFTITTTATVNQPALLTASVTVTNETCPGLNNGSADLTVAGGTTPYFYSWNPGAKTTEDITGLNAGNYSITVTDSKGCTVAGSYSVSSSPVLVVTVDSITNNPCGGGNNGAVYISATGGIAPYSYTWNPGGSTTEDITGLTSGNYSVTVAGSNGCTVSATATISNTSGFSASVDSTHHVVCYGENNGAVYVSTNGGVPPYTFAWSNSATTEDVTGLASGTYSVLITDGNTCVFNLSATVNQPALLTASASVTHESCAGNNDGMVDLAVAGGNFPYAYSWSPGGQTTQDISGLSAGNYSVIVTDNKGCTVNAGSYSVAPATPLTLALDSIHNNACSTGNNGGIYISVSGGTTPYSYFWNPGSKTTQDISGLAAGSYSVTITDDHGCTITGSYSVTAPSALLATVDSTDNSSCNGGSNGGVYISAGGGTSPYQYSWNPGGVTTQDITGIVAGNYSVVVTDLNGCTTTYTATVSTAPGTTTVQDSLHHVKCFGESNGAVFATTAGGTPPYTYAWSNSATTADITGLAAGTYSVLVTDVNSCTSGFSVTINQPALLTASATVTDESCSGSSNGTVDLTIAGGNSPYTYSWNPGGQTTQDITGLSGGSYSVTVSDTKGCSVSGSYTVAPAVPLTSVVDSTKNNLCSTGSIGAIYISVTGGTLPYSYLWNSGHSTQDISGLISGNYDVTVTDSKGCTFTNTISVTAPAALTASVSATVPAGCNFQNGSIVIQVNGGTPAYSYAWAPSGGTSSAAQAIGSGSYSCTITDMYGCTHLLTATLEDSCDYVWPGDANDDGIADNLDILAIGIGNGATGPVRPGASLSWYGQPCTNWANALADGTNYKHVDCNGDGIIDPADTNAVKLNYGSIHANSPGNPVTNANTDIYLVLPGTQAGSGGATINMQIGLGTSTSPATDVYGAAFKINFSDPTLIDPASVSFSGQNSWLGSLGTDMMFVGFPNAQAAAVTRTNQQNASGFGMIGTLSFKTSSSLNGTGNSAPLVVSITNPTVISFDETVIPVNPLSDSLTVKDTLLVTGSYNLNDARISIYPNPTSGLISIWYPENTTEISICDVLGRKVYHASNSFGAKPVTVDLREEPAGVYLLEIRSANGITVKKIIKE